MRRTPLRRKTPLRSRSPNASKLKKKTPTVTLRKQQLWELCKAITRARHGNTCYTCGKRGLTGSNWHTGHFIPSSVCSTELRYDLDNLRPQCYHCNINLSGNWPAFKKHLIADMGKQHVEALEVTNERTKGRKYDVLWYEQQIAHYRTML